MNNKKYHIRISIIVLGCLFLSSVVIAGSILINKQESKTTSEINTPIIKKDVIKTEESISNKPIINKAEAKITPKPVNQNVIIPQTIIIDIATTIDDTIANTVDTAITPDPQIEIIRQQIIQINEENKAQEAERLRKERCMVVNSQQEEDDYNSYVAHAQKELNYFIDYIASFEDPKSNAYILWKTAGGADAEYYRSLLPPLEKELNHQIDVRNKFLEEKASCN